MTKSLKPLPIGVATFRKIIEGGYLYVDKTQLIYELIRPPSGVYFLSRPRRFGKSLLVSTLEEVFAGQRELFRGLWLYTSDYHWEPYPIIRIDFSLLQVENAQQLKHAIKIQLGWIADQHQITLTDDEYNIQFAELLMKLGHEHQVVVLIDEYDKPLIDHLDNLAEAQRIRDILKGFYIVLKSMDRYLRFVFLTGVSKFSRVGVFSGLNSLYDISLHDRYAALPGITQEELEANFAPYIERFAMDKARLSQQLLEQIRHWYNGFAFSKAGVAVYNPFSLLQLLEAQDFRNYWFESGTPTFLLDLIKANLIKTSNYTIEQLNQVKLEEISFSTYDLENLAIVPLLYQTGYLTIKGYDETRRLFTLAHPNFEVENAFQTYLLGAFSEIEPNLSTSYLWQLVDALQANDLDEFFAVMHFFFAQIPYTIQIKGEKYYQTIFYLIFTLIGLRVQAEVATNRGRIDAVVELENAIYLFEFKVDESEQVALAQIKQTKYYERYQNKGKLIHLVGVRFDSQQRSIGGWTLKTL